MQRIEQKCVFLYTREIDCGKGTKNTYHVIVHGSNKEAYSYSIQVTNKPVAWLAFGRLRQEPFQLFTFDFSEYFNKNIVNFKRLLDQTIRVCMLCARMCFASP